MSVSTDGQICFGIRFDEGYQFPWRKKEYDFDIDEWWRDTQGYKPPFELFDSDGENLNGKEPTDEQVSKYFESQRLFDAIHRVPIKVINYCSGDAPMYIVAIPETFISNSRGYPRQILPTELRVTLEEEKSLIEFCKTYLLSSPQEDDEIQPDLMPRWYLSSYWG